MWSTHRIGLFVAPDVVHAYDLRLRTALGVYPALEAAFALCLRSRARVDVVLSDAHCRYLVLARPEGIRNRTELMAAARSRFRATFGDTDRWQLQLGSSPGGERDFVAGAESALVTEIEARATAGRVRVASIRPQWVAWARHFQPGTRRGNHWIVSADRTWASVGYVSDGQCLQARALRLDSGTSLEDLLARERALVSNADPAAEVWLGGLGLDAVATPFSGGRLTVAGPGALWNVPEGTAA